MTDFTTELNSSGLDAKFNPTSNIISDIIPGAVASVVDFGASVWNSLPGTDEVDTADLLRGINQDALRVYTENPDTIHTASFIGGMFVPTGLALKGMSAMRNGMKGINWFSEAGRTENLARVGKLFAEGGKDTVAYKKAARELYAKGAVNQAIDALAAETAILFTMNAHPMMEDYMDDPVKNFGISLALGGVLGAGIGHIADRFAIKGLAGNLAEETTAKVLLPLTSINPSMTGAMQVQRGSLNIKSLENIISAGEAAGKHVDDDLTLNIAHRAKVIEEVDQRNAFEAMISEDMKKLPVTDKEVLLDTFASSPSFYGVDSVSFVTEKSAIANGLITAGKEAIKTDKPILSAQKTKTLPDGVVGPTQILNKPTKSIYYPDSGQFGPAGSEIHYGNATILVTSWEHAAKRSIKTTHIAANPDTFMDVLAQSAPEVQANTITSLAKYEKLSIKDFERAVISNSDMDSLTGVLFKLRSTPELSGKTVTIKAPLKYGEGAVRLHGTSNELKLLDDDIAMNGSVDNIFGQGFYTTNNMEVATGYTKKGRGKSPTLYKVDEKAPVKLFDMEQPMDQNVKDILKKVIGDYDFEGSNSMIQSSKNLREFMNEFRAESSNFNLSKSDVQELFDGVRMNLEELGYNGYKHIGGIDKNPHDVNIYWYPKRDLSIEKLATDTKIQADEKIISQLIQSQKVQRIESLLANGIPLESIALRTNTPLSVVEAYSTSADRTIRGFRNTLNTIAENDRTFDATTGNKIFSKDSAEEALSIKHKPLVLDGNVRKNPYIEGHAALDNRTMTNIDKQFVSLILAGSKSELPRELGKYLDEQSNALDILYQKLGKISNELAGSRFGNSADFFSRNMGEVGPIMNGIGKQVQRMSNAMIGRVAEPIEKAMATVSTDPAAVTEFATFATLHSSIGGWRWFDAKTGQLMQKVEKTGADGKPTQVLEAIQWQGKEFSVKTPAVKELLTKMQDQSIELRNLHNTNNKILGKQDIQDIGFWMPSFNPVNKFIAYVHNAEKDTTKILYASTEAEYATVVKDYKKYLTDNGIKSERVIEKAEQKHWSMLNGRLDPIHMERADVSKLKTGSSSSALVKADLGIFGEIIGGYEHYITAQTRNLVDASLPDITGILDKLSSLNRWNFDNQPLTEVSKVAKAPKDAAKSMRNIMLGGTGLEEYQGWKSVNTSFETGLSMGLDFVGSAWKAATDPLTRTFLGGKKTLTPEALNKLDYEKFAKELETRGITNPYAHFDTEAAKMYGQSRLEDTPDISKRLVYASNALAATIALRVGELAQPLVNIMSLPILTQLAAANKMPETFMGKRLATTNVNTAQIMYEGMRASNDVKWNKIAKSWEDAGYFDPMISEVNKTLGMVRSFDKGLIPAAENAVNSRFVEITSKGADWSEAFVRRQTMFTGAILAKRLYPELDDVGVTIFARDFMDKAVGNFHAPQRPVFFQGTLGVALGLFQTYSLTLGQSIYRHLELKNYKALGKAMLTQSGIFGTGSLPGFNAISNLIGEHYSDEHVDLVTGSYRALQDNVAESILYGLPSQLGIGTHTRGDSNFRLPGYEGIVAVNFAKQVTQSVQQIADSVGQQDKSIPQAFAEALSLQNLSRPLARGAELAMGQSVTRQGNTVQTPEEVWTFSGVAARIIATRPMEEIKLRDAIHLKSFYGSIDSDNRRELLGDLKTRIRSGTLDDAGIAEASDRYLKSGGTPTGWRSAVRTAMAQEESTGKEVFTSKLRADSPLNYMIDNLDGF